MGIRFTLSVAVLLASANCFSGVQAKTLRQSEVSMPFSTADSPMHPKRPSTDAAKAEAKANPGGWVYEIGAGYNNTEAVPPQAIKGAWKVDDKGEITDEYKANPNYDPAFRKPGS